jgi:hypothetical protein
VTFATAAHFREHEADVALVSLCRSHGQRAVPYAEHLDDWRLALTAARANLVLFGDLATLARRGQWHGPLGRQDETGAAWERAVAARLLQAVESLDRHPDWAAVREGTPT